MMTNAPVVLILVDGMRPDALMQADTPTIIRLLKKGTYTYGAQTVIPSVTLPCITSIFLGVPPEDHYTIGNYWNSSDWQAPGLIDLVRQSGGQTASFYNWEQLRDISRPGSLDISVCINSAESQDLPLGESDNQVVDIASLFISSSNFDFIFVYLGCLDTAGHRHGWMSPEYLQTLGNADKCIDRLLKSVPDSASVVIASDHGGHDHDHGTGDPQDMTVPLIISSSKIRPGQLATPVSVLDIAPTVASLLGLNAPKEWIGKSLV
jgi:predicted AlkP superfamily pyrophosphatase or phosphodiesterase